MMRQQVNFFRPTFLPAPKPLSARHILLILSFAGIILFAVLFQGRQQLEQKQALLDSLKTQQREISARLAALPHPQMPSSSRQQSLATLSRQRAAKQRVLTANLSKQPPLTTPFSETLRHIAQARTMEITVTRVEIVRHPQRLIIEGVAPIDQPEGISHFIEELTNRLKPDPPGFIIDRVGSPESQEPLANREAQRLFFRLLGQKKDGAS
ncbi:MAG: hypothetical protein HQL72_15125 [Magnetococcales bacterium]|nr:hypothetical protein [Magnetococcales bacterium]